MSSLALNRHRVGLTFHRTFPLNTPSVSRILLLSLETGGQITRKQIREATGLGTAYVEAMPRYAQACGLMDIGSYRLTPLGEVVCRQDPHLMHPATLWLMHYHLSAPHGPGPAFWSHLATVCLQFGEDTAGAEVAPEITRYLESQEGGHVAQARAVRSSATIFVGTYTKSDGLGRLGLLMDIPGRNGYVLVSEPQSPPAGAVAYALADYWSAQYGDQLTVSLSELTKDGSFARLMWMSPRGLEEAVEALRVEGILDLYRVAPPHQVARRWMLKEDLLRRVYG